MYVGIDPEVAAQHRQLVNRHWAEMERLRKSVLQAPPSQSFEWASARRRLGAALIALGVRFSANSAAARPAAINRG